MKSRVVVLVSANSEWRALKEILPSAAMRRSPYGEWFETTTRDTGLPAGVIFMHGGWGKIAAAGSTQYAIDQWRPDLLVNLGTCGGFEGEIERGTIVLVERAVVYDIIEQMGDFDAHIAHYSTDLDLTWLGEAYPAAVRRALLVSADRDLLSEDIPGLKKRYQAVAGDWESGAIAWVAGRNGVRLIILRGVTDLVSDSGGEAYGNIELFHTATSGIMGRLMAALPLWLAAAGIDLTEI
jgi:adenosylhomocysteine nucleosidase